MKIDKTTYKDRKERQIGMTADRTSQFLFFKSHRPLHTLASHPSHKPTQVAVKRVQFPNALFIFAV